MKKILITSLGSCLQWFDNTLFQILVPLMIFNFVPQQDNLSQSFSLVMAYSASLFTRPFGAIIFGHFADMFGRKKVLLIAPFVMGCAMLSLGLCPSVKTVGVAAPAFLLLFTFLHGFSSGAEWIVSSCLLYENSSVKNYHLNGLVLSLCLIVGIFLADLLMGFLLRIPNPLFIGEYLWRLVFLLSAFFSFFLVYLRKNLSESLPWEKSEENFNAFKVLRQEKGAFFLSFAFCALDGVLFNLVFNNLFPFADERLGRVYSFDAIVLVLICLYFLYQLFKKWGAIKSAIAASLASVIICLIQIIHPDPTALLSLKLLFALPAFLFLMTMPLIAPALFKVRNRAFMLAMSRSTAIFIFGGLGPIAMKWLLKPSGVFVAIYVIFAALLSLSALTFITKKKINFN